MKLFESEQIKMINRTFPIQFTEDEFRLEEDLTYKRLYKRLNSLKDIELTNAYYLIHVKYRDYFRDRQNEYQAKLYDILHDVCENRGMDLRKYLRDVTKRKKTIDIYVIIFSIFSFIFLRNIIPFQIIISLIGLLALWKWDNLTVFIAKRINRKAIHVQQYKEIPCIFIITASVALVLDLRTYNSLLYLLAGYLLTLIYHIICFRSYEKNVYKELEPEKVKKFKLTVRIYSLIMTILIIIGMFGPILDFIGTKFDTGSIMYVEGICTDTKDLWFGYKQATINGVTINLNTKNKDVEIGDFFKVEYGKHTHAVTKVIRKDILSRFKDENSSENTSSVMDDYFNTLKEFEENENISEKENK